MGLKLKAIVEILGAVLAVANEIEEIKARKKRRKTLSNRDRQNLGSDIVQVIESVVDQQE